MKIYERYLYKEIAKVFFLFLFGFYFLYSLIDLSVNLKTMQHGGISFFETLSYVSLQFIKMTDLLIPFALLIASIKVLTTLNMKNEMVALLTSGISKKKLARPFFFVSLLLASLLYLNFQFIQPLFLPKLHHYEETYLKGKNKNASYVHHLMIEKGGVSSTLLFQNYNPKEETFFDVFWIINPNEIYRIKTLHPFAKKPFGKCVDHLFRDKSGEFVKKKSFDTFSFPELTLNRNALFSKERPPKWQSLTELLKNLNWKDNFKGKTSDKKALFATLSFSKLLLPWVSLLGILAILPICLKFSRHHFIFLIYSTSIFGMIAFFTLIRAASILGSSQVLPPLLVSVLPYGIFFSIFGIRYARI